MSDDFKPLRAGADALAPSPHKIQEEEDAVSRSETREISPPLQSSASADGGVTTPAPNWEPITSAPRDKTRLLTYTGEGRCEVLRFEDGEWTDGEYTYGPTHWLPLPAPPRADAREAPQAEHEATNDTKNG